jgi:phosphatidylglycerophosphatase A
MNRVSRAVILFISQGAYAGRFPLAPGTAGTFVGLILFLVMQDLAPVHYLALSILIILVGTWTAGRAEIILGHTDSPSIVIDEVAGYLVSMFMVPSGWLFVVSGFLLFRAFDIIKPWPLRRLQELHGGPGVMLDDIGAGIYSNILLQIAAYYKLL